MIVGRPYPPVIAFIILEKPVAVDAVQVYVIVPDPRFGDNRDGKLIADIYLESVGHRIIRILVVRRVPGKHAEFRYFPAVGREQPRGGRRGIVGQVHCEFNIPAPDRGERIVVDHLDPRIISVMIFQLDGYRRIGFPGSGLHGLGDAQIPQRIRANLQDEV